MKYKHARLSIQDTMDVVGGKWKLILIFVLFDGKKKFNELTREIGISPRVLSKELHELEVNGLIKRRVCDTKPVTVEYSLAPYSESLKDVIVALCKWGEAHRENIIAGKFDMSPKSKSIL
ncbi:winged helix-turn-helix transcriptional regulator [Flavobacterium aquicola]|uniref:HxlR family transcriptional regulator n=1 Tax=Flavobacterium aquicola TaxID=1682742 RepID=A0A3E0EMH2_9FLAO|nr:helix-turn-helix domain-containing protein [Flavobacterium aquicola]REG99452.1 HxlR family transcriptional regulator [Flavobacterium aquicola]